MRIRAHHPKVKRYYLGKEIGVITACDSIDQVLEKPCMTGSLCHHFPAHGMYTIINFIFHSSLPKKFVFVMVHCWRMEILYFIRNIPGCIEHVSISSAEASFDEYLLSTFYVLDTSLGFWNTMMNKMDKDAFPHRTYISVWMIGNKY